MGQVWKMYSQPNGTLYKCFKLCRKTKFVRIANKIAYLNYTQCILKYFRDGNVPTCSAVLAVEKRLLQKIWTVWAIDLNVIRDKEEEQET